MNDELRQHIQFPSKTIFHIDFDYFYAQCEEIRKPELKDVPTLICVYSGREVDSGVISTCNYEARKFGIRSAMPIKLARGRLKNNNAVFLPADIPYYLEISSQVMNLIQKYEELFEQGSVDECYVDFTRITNADFEDARNLAKSIQKNIREKMKLSCSIGIGPNKLISKIASNFHKPNGITVIEPQEVVNFLAECKIDDIPGIGPKTSKRLAQLGIKSICDISKTSIFRLKEIFGYKTATYLVNSANGIDYSPIKVRETSKQIGKIVTLKKNIQVIDQIFDLIKEICIFIFNEMDRRKQSFRIINILIIMDDLHQISNSKSLRLFSTSFEELHTTSLSIIKEAIIDKLSLNNIRRFGIVVSDLRNTVGQNSLLDYL